MDAGEYRQWYLLRHSGLGQGKVCGPCSRSGLAALLGSRPRARQREIHMRILACNRSYRGSASGLPAPASLGGGSFFGEEEPVRLGQHSNFVILFNTWSRKKTTSIAKQMLTLKFSH